MRTLRISNTAKDNLADIAAHITLMTMDRGIGDRLVADILARCTRIASLPGTLGTARPDLRNDIRSSPHSGYVIFFRYIDENLDIVNVLDAHRDVIAYFAEAMTDD